VAKSRISFEYILKRNGRPSGRKTVNTRCRFVASKSLSF
jgi:hypothetical protein